MQPRVSIVGQIAGRCKPCLSDWPLAWVWELGFGKVPTILWPEKKNWLSLHCWYSVFHANMCFPSESLEVWEPVNTVCLYDGPSKREPPPRVDSISHMLSVPTGGVKGILCDATGRGLNVGSWSPVDFTPCAFFLCWLDLSPFFLKKKIKIAHWVLWVLWIS